MPLPRIQTAIPKRRYRFGPYEAVLLGEIESPDPVRYHFILAVVRDGASKPGLFVTAEKNPRAHAQDGSHCMRVISEQTSEVLGSSNDYADADAFADAALAVAARTLGLSGITPVRQM